MVVSRRGSLRASTPISVAQVSALTVAIANERREHHRVGIGEVGQRGDQRARAAVGERLPDVAHAALVELFGGDALLQAFLVMREQRREHKEGDEQHPPRQPAEAEDRCADDHRAERAAGAERCPPPRDKRDEAAEEDAQ